MQKAHIPIISTCRLLYDRIRLKLPPELYYILTLFIITRIILTIIGTSSSTLLNKGLIPFTDTAYRFLNIWGSWDSGWYFLIARDGYSPAISAEATGKGMANYGFFPGYPLLMRGVAFFTNSFFISGLIISNVCLIISALFLYKLVRLESSVETARRAVKYLFLFPSAFILSGVFSESLFLALFIVSYYYAKRQEWYLCGIAGYCFALTRPNGVLMLASLLYEYAASRSFQLKKFNLSILYLLLIPLGILTFMVFTFFLTGDLFAYCHVKITGWHHRLSNPFMELYIFCRFSDQLEYVLNGWWTIIIIVVMTIFYKKLGFAYWLIGMLFSIATVVNGPAVLTSMLRHTIGIFPFYILLAKLTEKKYTDDIVTIISALLQGFMMVFWSTGFRFIV